MMQFNQTSDENAQAKTSRLLSLIEVQKKINMGRTFVYNEMASGRIRPLKMGRALRFVEAEIDQWIADRIAAR